MGSICSKLKRALALRRERKRQQSDDLARMNQINLEELRGRLGKEKLNRQLGIVEDFYSTRAMAHASFFVASVFGLFTILTLIEAYLQRTSSSWAIAPLSIIYWGVFIFGLYSFTNFSCYANLAENAESKTAGEADSLIKARKVHAHFYGVHPARNFSDLKSSSYFANHNKTLFLSAYFLGSLLVFIISILNHF